MKIGIPKEIKNNENRVGIIPTFVTTLTRNGHEVFIEQGAGVNAGISDEDYKDAGGQILQTAEEIWSQDMVIKVKEPLEPEYKFLRSDLLLYTYLHLAAEPKLTKALVDSGCTAIAYETVEYNGALPLLRPMSEVAGRRAPIIGATYLEKHRGGSGIVLSGIPGVAPGVVTVIGGGVSGINAVKIALGLGAKVNVLELNEDKLRYLDDIFGNSIVTLKSNEHNLAEAVKEADLLISTILIPGAKAPKIVTEAMVKSMKPGSVIIDISIDQGGSVATIDRVTTHDDPVYEKHGVIHYAVANMPGATPRTSTYGLTNATMPYALQIANKGWRNACQQDEGLAKGLNVTDGKVICKPVATALGYEHTPIDTVL